MNRKITLTVSDLLFCGLAVFVMGGITFSTWLFTAIAIAVGGGGAVWGFWSTLQATRSGK